MAPPALGIPVSPFTARAALRGNLLAPPAFRTLISPGAGLLDGKPVFMTAPPWGAIASGQLWQADPLLSPPEYPTSFAPKAINLTDAAQRLAHLQSMIASCELLLSQAAFHKGSPRTQGRLYDQAIHMMRAINAFARGGEELFRASLLYASAKAQMDADGNTMRSEKVGQIADGIGGAGEAGVRMPVSNGAAAMGLGARVFVMSPAALACEAGIAPSRDEVFERALPGLPQDYSVDDINRILPEGVHQVPNGGTAVRIYAPDVANMALLILDPSGTTKNAVFMNHPEVPTPGVNILHSIPLYRDSSGNFIGVSEQLVAGALYLFQLDYSDGRRELAPDFFSESQPAGVFGPSQIVSSNYRFRHGRVPRDRMDMVIYEADVGTFSRAGTFRGMVEGAALDRLRQLRAMGFNTIELMPVMERMGEISWGYDGSFNLAPHHSFGSKDDLKALVDALHELGFSVIFDVQMNHLGVMGNMLGKYGRSRMSIFSDLETPWGQQMELAGLTRGGTREDPALADAVAHNVAFLRRVARQYVEEYAADGERWDMTDMLVGQHGQWRSWGTLWWDRARERISQVVDEMRAVNSDAHFIAEDHRAEDLGGHLYSAIGPHSAWQTSFKHVVQAVCGGPDQGNFGWVTMDDLFRVMQAGVRRLRIIDDRGAREDPNSIQPGVIYASSHDEVGNHSNAAVPMGRSSVKLFPHGYRMATALSMTGRGIPMVFMGEENATRTPYRNYFMYPWQPWDSGDPHARAAYEAERRGLRDQSILEQPDGSYPGDRGQEELVTDLLKLRAASGALRSRDANATVPLRIHNMNGYMVLLRRGQTDDVIVATNASGIYWDNQPIPVPKGRWVVEVNTQDPKYCSDRGDGCHETSHGLSSGVVESDGTTPVNLHMPPHSVVILRHLHP